APGTGPAGRSRGAGGAPARRRHPPRRRRPRRPPRPRGRQGLRPRPAALPGRPHPPRARQPGQPGGADVMNTIAAMPVTVSLVGTTRLVVGTREIALSSRKSLALLTYLALQPTRSES